MSLQRLVVICCIMFTSAMISYTKQDNRRHHDKYSRIQNIKGGRETFEDYESTPIIKKFNIEASPQNLLGDSMQIKMKGADGIDGKDGPDGDAGPLGPAGPPGVPGPKGDAGICQPSECDYLNIMPMVARVTTLERYATEGGSGMSGGVEEAPAAGGGEGAAAATGLGGGAGFGGGGGVGSPGGGSGGGGGGGGADSATSTETTSPSVPVPPSTPDSPSKSSTTSGGGGGGSAGSMGSAAGAGSGVGGGTGSKREIKGKETFNLFHQLNDGAIKGNEVNTIKRSTLPKHPDIITSDYWKKFDLKTKNGVPVDEE